MASKKIKNIRTLKLVMGEDKYEIIMDAIKKMKAEAQIEGMEISDSRALEFIAISYLNEIQKIL
jgi:hypothetical protein